MISPSAKIKGKPSAISYLQNCSINSSFKYVKQKQCTGIMLQPSWFIKRWVILTLLLPPYMNVDSMQLSRKIYPDM